MFLLLPFSPVSVLKDPLPCSRQKLPTTLGAGDANQSKSPFSIHPTGMFEAQKFERLRPSQSVSLTCHACKSPKEYAPSLFLGQLQTEFREPLLHLLLEMVNVLPILETHHEIVSEAYEIRLAPTLRFNLLFKPQIENKMEVEVTQHG